MKFLIILGVLIIVTVIFYACNFGGDKSKNTIRPPEDTKPSITEDNDKIIVVDNANHDDIRKALTGFCNLYNKNKYVALPRLTSMPSGSFVITFPYNTDFATFCFATNFIKYPLDIKWNAHVRAWATTKQGDDWITDKSVNKKVMLFLADDDKEYDNVFMTTQDEIGYKLGFASGKEKQLLSTPKEKYIEPSVNIKQLGQLEFEDFK